jgi:hypothetical protein
MCCACCARCACCADQLREDSDFCSVKYRSSVQKFLDKQARGGSWGAGGGGWHAYVASWP